MIIGITGTLGAGKGTIVECLLKKGFKHYSVRDFLVEEIMRRGLESNRDNMVLVANDLRAKNNPSYIVEQLYSRAKEVGGDAVIESVRCVGEVDALRKKKDFILFAVDADVETRYVRIVERKSVSDRVSFEDFVRQEQREMVSDNPNEQNLKRCIELADYSFKNDWTVEELHKKVENILNKIKNGVGEKHSRPTWDEYFMKLASLVAERSTCLRHNIGAVIVKDKRVITSGYNGSARGAPNCSEVGCLKNELKIKTGTGHEICRAVHAEMNAIIQGAIHGISVYGSTIYCTHTPCTLCARMIVNAGIKRVVSYHNYSDESARKFLEQSGVILDKVNKPSEKIKFLD
ncbi:AAA family ATPase [Candidatus Pacearchaeota archaeon]|nr:AAA family ATPase [Candidatus Pacearchaeota archaeon]